MPCRRPTGLRWPIAVRPFFGLILLGWVATPAATTGGASRPLQPGWALWRHRRRGSTPSCGRLATAPLTTTGPYRSTRLNTSAYTMWRSRWAVPGVQPSGFGPASWRSSRHRSGADASGTTSATATWNASATRPLRARRGSRAGCAARTAARVPDAPQVSVPGSIPAGPGRPKSGRSPCACRSAPRMRSARKAWLAALSATEAATAGSRRVLPPVCWPTSALHA
jgi:hypothetical protein